jgi:hypothetical protein
MSFPRNTFFHFNNRLGLSYWGKERNDKGHERLYNNVFVPWTAEVISSRGAHYHVWIDPKYKEDTKGRIEFLQRCYSAATDLGDVVRFSFDYIPEDE